MKKLSTRRAISVNTNRWIWIHKKMTFRRKKYLKIAGMDQAPRRK